MICTICAELGRKCSVCISDDKKRQMLEERIWIQLADSEKLARIQAATEKWERIGLSSCEKCERPTISCICSKGESK